MKKVGKTTSSFRYDLNQILSDYTVEVKNRFRGLVLLDTVPEELCTEDYSNTGGGDQNHPKENGMQNAKWLPKEALQIAEKRRETKSMGRLY